MYCPSIQNKDTDVSVRIESITKLVKIEKAEKPDYMCLNKAIWGS